MNDPALHLADQPDQGVHEALDAVADEVTRLGECAERLAGCPPASRARILRHLNDLFAEPRTPRTAASGQRSRR